MSIEIDGPKGVDPWEKTSLKARTSALKRIEEKHAPDRCEEETNCLGCDSNHNPCDVVKLACALANLLDTYGPVRPLSGTAWAKAERTLEEVAGE